MKEEILQLAPQKKPPFTRDCYEQLHTYKLDKLGQNRDKFLEAYNLLD